MLIYFKMFNDEHIKIKNSLSQTIVYFIELEL